MEREKSDRKPASACCGLREDAFRMRQCPGGQCHIQSAGGEAGLSGPPWMGMKVKLQRDQTTSAGPALQRADSELLAQIPGGIRTHQPRPEPLFGSFIPCLTYKASLDHFQIMHDLPGNLS